MGRAVEAMRALARGGVKVPRFDELDAAFGHPFPIPALVSDELEPDEALALWSEARAMPGLGLVPLLVGAEPMIDDLDRLGTRAAGQRIRARVKKASADPAAIIGGIEARLAERFSPVVLERLRAEMESVRAAWLVRPGAAPPAIPDPQPERLFDASEPARCLLLGCAPWEVPLYVGLGGHSGSPLPHEQAALLKRWHERHGVALVHVGRGDVAMHAQRPVARVEELRPLLWEVFLYCYDAAFGDADGTFAGLRRMLASPWWKFGWD